MKTTNLVNKHFIVYDQWRPNTALKSFAALKAHVRFSGKSEAYRKMLQSMGVNETYFMEKAGQPSFVFSEQPFALFQPEYDCLFSLMDRVKDEFEVKGGLSGIYFLNNDKFCFKGLKKEHNLFNPGGGLKVMKYVSNKFIELNEGKTYNSALLTVEDKELLISDFALLRDVLVMAKDTAENPHLFRNLINKMPHAVVLNKRRIDDLLDQKVNLLELHEYLNKIDLGVAIDDLNKVIGVVTNALSWADLWAMVAGVIHGRFVKKSDNILNEIVLQIKDPDKLADFYADLIGHDRSLPLALINIVQENESVSLYYDFGCGAGAGKRIFVNAADGEKKYFGWDQVLAMAENGQTAGPAYIIKYLLRAALNIYHFVNESDGLKNTKYDDCIAKVHFDLIGVPFPWVSPDFGAVGALGTGFLGRYEKNHKQKVLGAVDKFFVS